MAEDGKAPIIIKKVKKGGHAHHGGAWKIAYADFVTAMMAFFLLMWLINMTTPEQKAGLADYFSPSAISFSQSGAGGVMGGTAMNRDGAQNAGTSQSAAGGATNTDNSDEYGAQKEAGRGQRTEQGGANEATNPLDVDIRSRNRQVFQSAAASIRQALDAMPEITQIRDNLLIQETRDGLDIVLMNQQGRSMFPENSKKPYDYTQKAVEAIAPVLQQLPYQIRVAGHASAHSPSDGSDYGPWELTSDRANAIRAILEESGLKDGKIHSVMGRGTVDPLFPDNPYMAANERISITLLNNPPPVPTEMNSGGL